MAMAVPSPSHAATRIDIALPFDPAAAPIRVVRPAAAATLSGLAAVELQLIMQLCDAQSLLALARCSRFTLSAASDPFAWPGPSSFSLVFVHTPGPDAESDAEQQRPKGSAWQRLCSCFRPAPPPSPLPLPLAQRISESLLRFCDIKINWRDDDQYSPVSDAELDGLAAIPRLRALNSCGRWHADPAEIESLVRRPGLHRLTALTCSGRQLDEAVTEALADHCPRLSAVKIFDTIRSDPPLHLLPALTDLSVRVHHECGLIMAAVARCARLRCLTVSAASSKGYSSLDVYVALLSPSLRTLEHLCVHDLDALHTDGRNMPAVRLNWAAAFANLPALRSLGESARHRSAVGWRRRAQPLRAAAIGAPSLQCSDPLRRIRVRVRCTVARHSGRAVGPNAFPPLRRAVHAAAGVPRGF
jgi:hypothetical protein